MDNNTKTNTTEHDKLPDLTIGNLKRMLDALGDDEIKLHPNWHYHLRMTGRMDENGIYTVLDGEMDQLNVDFGYEEKGDGSIQLKIYFTS